MASSMAESTTQFCSIAKVTKPYGILFYREHDPEYVKKFYRHQDEKGLYRIATLNAPGIRHGESGQPWRDVNPSDVGRHWSTPRREAWPEGR